MAYASDRWRWFAQTSSSRIVVSLSWILAKAQVRAPALTLSVTRHRVRGLVSVNHQVLIHLRRDVGIPAIRCLRVSHRAEEDDGDTRGNGPGRNFAFRGRSEHQRFLCRANRDAFETRRTFG